MEKTIFQKIIDREIPAKIVYEDEEFLAFLDINPVRKGHTLLMPKEQYQWVQDAPNELISKTFIKMKELIIAIKKATMCDYVQVVIEGIQVPHFHIHLIPSMNGQENAKWTHLNYEDGEAEVVTEKIKSSL